MLEHLTTEARNPASTEIDRLSALDIAQLINREDAGVAQAVGLEVDRIAAAIRLIADRLRAGGRLIYIGAGTSGRLGVLDAAECPPTFSTPPDLVVGLIAGGNRALVKSVEGAEDHPEVAEHDLSAIGLGEEDAVVGIATSGRTPYVIGGLRYARSLGALAIGLSCNRDSELTSVTDLMILPVVGPEVISGSTRLKAGTATKLALNMISTGTMVLLGKTYGNLMVDLRATNSKLLDRSRRIIEDLTNLPGADAEALLQRCGGEVKTAVVADRLGVCAADARAALARADGHLRVALEQSRQETTGDRESGDGESLPPQPVVASPQGRRAADLVLGVEGGGTRTTAWIATRIDGDETVLGAGTSGPSNPRAVGVGTALANLEEAIQSACRDADVVGPPFASACLGLAGTGRLVERTLVEDWARAIGLAENIEVVSDAEPLLAAGTPEGWGVAIIAGTGSLAVARGSDGQFARAGGWGELFGDEGSGYSVAVAGLRAAAKSVDNRSPETVLLSRMMRRLRAASPGELVTAIYQKNRDRRQIAMLASEVVEAAANSDVIAKRILADAAAELAEMVHAAADRAGLAGRPYPLALTGGLLQNAAYLRKELLEALDIADLTAEPVTIVEAPVAGAIIRARALLPEQSTCENVVQVGGAT